MTMIATGGSIGFVRGYEHINEYLSLDRAVQMIITSGGTDSPVFK